MAPTAREVLNRLKWERGSDLSRAEIWVRDRAHPEGSRVLHGGEIVDLGRRYFSTTTATIPFYKITRIVHDGTVLFERREGGPRSPLRTGDLT
ncbi:MAG TPA: RNA repair domain-containing protein [Thermoplasmata archaeon]|nr:RNA repair domain-containing protein [Thermoplasmata archaeon]